MSDSCSVIHPVVLKSPASVVITEGGSRQVSDVGRNLSDIAVVTQLEQPAIGQFAVAVRQFTVVTRTAIGQFSVAQTRLTGGRTRQRGFRSPAYEAKVKRARAKGLGFKVLGFPPQGTVRKDSCA